jgi:hypothetical protein
MAYPLAGFSDQPKHAALSNALPLTKFHGSRASRVLGYQVLDCLGRQPPGDAALPAKASASSWSEPRRIHDVRQQRRVQFESPQADTGHFQLAPARSRRRAAIS